MATKSNITSARALETAQFDLSSVSDAMRDAFRDMLESLALLVEIEEYFASDWCFDPAFAVDPGESVHAFSAVRAAVRKVRELPPALPGHKALKLAALLVQLAIDMEEAMDRTGVHETIVHARACLLLEADAPEAAVTNHLLSVAFTRLDRLTALETGDAPLSKADDYHAEPDPVFCA